MAIKDLLKVTKADRYTQDGRDQLNEALQADVEDRTYKPGDISQKTGLQKQPDGSWAPPKGGAKKPAGKQNPDIESKRKALAENLVKNFKQDPEAAKGIVATMKEGDVEKKFKQLQKETYVDPKAANKTTVRQGPNTKTLNETPAEHIQKNLDHYKGYRAGDMEQLVLGPSGYEINRSTRIPRGGTSVTYKKEGAEDITLFFDKHGELENADVSAESKPGRDYPILKKEDHVSLANEVKSNTMPGSDWTAEEIAKEWKLGKADAEEVKKEFDNLRKGSSGNKPAESKPAAASDIPDFKGMASEDYDKKLRSEGWTTGGWEGSGTHASAIFKKGDRTIRVNEGQPGKITSVQEISKPAPRTSVPDAAPRVLTGDTRIRVRK